MNSFLAIMVVQFLQKIISCHKSNLETTNQKCYSFGNKMCHPSSITVLRLEQNIVFFWGHYEDDSGKDNK
jgi:hypothetical protein